jgi:hypothetical protein
MGLEMVGVHACMRACVRVKSGWVRWCDLSGFGGAEGHFTSPFAAFSSHVLLLFASILHPVFLLRSLQYDVTLYAACKAASLCYSAVGCTAEGVPKWTARTSLFFLMQSTHPLPKTPALQTTSHKPCY